MSMPLSSFETLYAGKAPWDIGKPQGSFTAIADRVTGPVLDIGCGTGEHALYFASRGNQVTGIDFVEEAIQGPQAKAAERRISVEFLVKDALTLGDWDRRFASAIDCGLFHVFSDDDRHRYVQGLTNVVEPGGHLFLATFSDEEPGTEGPRRVSRQELNDAFAKSWGVESIQACRFEVNPENSDFTFSKGGPKGWFMVARRKG